ncbi:MAG: hypothetical protein IPJ65_33130 [Archangiaceae bacterium]|nr:hypothetical protein [Archangiaceae bacterium]
MLASASAAAHVADEIVVTLDEATLTETLTLTADTLAMLAPIDADADGELTQADLDARRAALVAGVWEQAKLEPCTRSAESASLEPGYVELKARFQCPPGELSQEFRWLMVLPPQYRVIAGDQVAHGDQRTVHLRRGVAEPPPRGRFGPLDVAAAALIVAGAVGAAYKRTRWPGAALALFALGFWLVHRLLV